MNPEIKKRWIDALRSGEYKQGYIRLETVREEGSSFCCLGVLCHLAMQDGVVSRSVQDGLRAVYGESAIYTLPLEVEEWAGNLELCNPMRKGPHLKDDLANLNDNRKLTFHQIADVIEEAF